MPISNEQEPINRGDSHQSELETARTATTLPHSGVNFDEKPVYDFDKTSLREASERGVLGQVPENADGLVAHTFRTDKPESRATDTKQSRRGLKIAAGLLALGVSLGIGVKEMTEKPKQTPTALTADKPEATPTVATDTESQETDTNTPGSNGSKEQDAQKAPEIQIPDSDSPDQVTAALMTNLQSAMNTNDPSYINMYLSDMSQASKVLEKMNLAEKFREEVPLYKSEINAKVKAHTSFNNPESPYRALDLEVEELDVYNTIGTTRVGKRYNYTQTLVLTKVERTIVSEQGQAKKVQVWLVEKAESSERTVTNL